MIKKHILHSLSAQLIYQTAINHRLEANIESARFNLFSVNIGGRKIYIKGTNIPVNSQSSCLIACNKFLTKRILKQNSISTPKSWLVSSRSKARKLVVDKNIFPCVIKPIFGAHGNEVYANIESLEELDDVLCDLSKKKHGSLLIEEYISGIDYRVLVVGDMVSAVIQRTPAHIIGDGSSTIRELIQKFNTNPLIGKKFEKPMCKIRINFELMRTLKKNKKKLSSVIRRDKKVFLKQNANISAGGISADATNTTNQGSLYLAVKAAQAIGMEFCGVDIMYDNTTGKSYVLEINDCPGIDIHHFPTVGDSQNVAEDIIQYLIFKNENTSDFEEANPSYKDWNLSNLSTAY